VPSWHLRARGRAAVDAPWDDIGVQNAPPDAPAEPGPLPAAVLRHVGAPGGDHFDILLAVREPRDADDRACATWRCAVDPGTAGPGQVLEVEPIAPHRALYLRLAAPRELGDGRGRVEPVRRGAWRRIGEAIECRWEDGSVTRVVPESIGRWRRAEP
jgi:hypothetical protein